MNTWELMIGDWVLYRKNNTPYKIVGIEPMEGLGPREGFTFKLTDSNEVFLFVRAASVAPVPITSDILEKNGFVWNLECEQFMLPPYSPDVSYSGAIFYANSKYAQLELYECIYVHQMQQALRLAGIEKEIVL